LSSREETPLSEAAGTEGTNAESTENTEVAEDEVFEGEEEETTLHSIKAKISKLAVEGGKGEWKPMGLGWLKLKRHDESGTQRILLRDSTSRRVILVSDNWY
jgi:nucleoporin NUP2